MTWIGMIAALVAVSQAKPIDIVQNVPDTAVMILHAGNLSALEERIIRSLDTRIIDVLNKRLEDAYEQSSEKMNEILGIQSQFSANRTKPIFNFLKTYGVEINRPIRIVMMHFSPVELYIEIPMDEKVLQTMMASIKKAKQQKKIPEGSEVSFPTIHGSESVSLSLDADRPFELVVRPVGNIAQIYWVIATDSNSDVKNKGKTHFEEFITNGSQYPLSKNSQWTQIQSGLLRAKIKVLVNPKRMMGLVKEISETTGEDESRNLGPLAMFGSGGFAEMMPDAMGMGLIVEESEIGIESKIMTPYSELMDSLYLPANERNKSNALNLIPSDFTIFARLNFNWSAYYELIKSYVGIIPMLGDKVFTRFEQEFEENIEMSFTKDILPNLQGDLNVNLADVDMVKKQINLTLSAGLKNPEPFQRLLTKIAAIQPGDQKIRGATEQISIGGISATKVNAGDFNLYMQVKDQNLLITSSEALLLNAPKLGSRSFSQSKYSFVKDYDVSMLVNPQKIINLMIEENIGRDAALYNFGFPDPNHEEGYKTQDIQDQLVIRNAFADAEYGGITGKMDPKSRVSTSWIGLKGSNLLLDVFLKGISSFLYQRELSEEDN